MADLIHETKKAEHLSQSLHNVPSGCRLQCRPKRPQQADKPYVGTRYDIMLSLENELQAQNLSDRQECQQEICFVQQTDNMTIREISFHVIESQISFWRMIVPL